MFKDIEKFKKEISALPRLMQPKVLDSVRSREIKEKLLLTVAQNKPTSLPAYTPPVYAFSHRSNRLLRYVISILVGLSLFGGTAYASNSSIPGETLYPFKIFKEKFQLKFTFGDEQHALLEAKFAQERLDELLKITEQEGNPNSKNTASTQEQQKTKDNAKNEAGKEVRHAIQVLGGVKLKLEAKEKVNTKAVAAIEKNIEKLEQNAKNQNIETHEPNGNANGLQKQEDKQKPNNKDNPTKPIENNGKSQK